MASRKSKEYRPKYVPEHCRCFAVEVGGYYYALMMTAVLRVPGRGRSMLTSDLVCVLNYRAKEPPATLDVFESREWMRLYFGEWAGKQLIMWCARDRKFEKAHLIPVGEVAPRPGDPFESPKVGWWDGLLAVLEEVSALPEITSRG